MSGMGFGVRGDQPGLDSGAGWVVVVEDSDVALLGGIGIDFVRALAPAAAGRDE